MTRHEVLDQDGVPIEIDPGLARNAGVLALGNAGSRGLGLLREMVIAALFGATGEVSAFRVASQVPVLLYDFLVGGMLSAALVPVLSDHVPRARRRGGLMGAYGELTGVLFSLFATVLTLLVIGLELAAPRLAWLLAGGFAATDSHLLLLTTQLIRWAAPTVWLLSMAGLLTAMLFSLQRFAFPAIATAIYNLGIVVAAPLLAESIGIFSLVVGVLAGCLAQFLLMGVDLWRAGVRLRWHWKWRHPALFKIFRLYLPIGAGLIVSLFQVGLDRRLASGTGEQSIAWMSNATTLQQMPLGLISVAISLAALPRLSQYYADRQDDDYRHTLGRGLRMVLLLIVPAAVGMWVLGEPLARVLFERNRFTPEDTQAVTQALNIYVVGMVFAAVDFPLNFAFYARSNTWLPAIVGVASVGVYVLAAFALIEGLGYLGLVWADSAKHASHALIMVGLLRWRVGSLHAHIGRGVASVVAGSAGMAVVMYFVAYLLETAMPSGTMVDITVLVLAGVVGSMAYAGILWRLEMPEMRQVLEVLGQRVGTLRFR